MPNKPEKPFLKHKLKIAVTGGIGSGKSVLCRFFESHGYYVVNADLVAKNLMINDVDVRKKLIKSFGSNIYTETGLNNKFIAELIFQDNKKLEEINSIVHPATIKKISELVEAELLLKDIVFVESALIFEAKREKLYDYILLVTAKEENRIERIMKRDKVSKQEAMLRIQSQLSDEEKRKKSHFIITNDLTEVDLLEKANMLLRVFEKLIIDSK